MNDTKRIVQKLAGTFNKDFIEFEVCSVNSVNVNEGTCDCTPIGGNATTDLAGCFMQADVPSDGFMLQPTVGSTVIIGITLRNQYYVVLTSQVDAVLINIPTGVPNTWTKLIINANGIQMNDGSYGGLIEIANLTSKLNNLVTQVQGQLTLIAAAITSLGGAYTPGALSAFVQANYENTKVTHGK